MDRIDITDLEVVLERIRGLAETENIRITQHAQQEMVEEDITFDEVLEAITTGKILENYPEHRRGACCLLCGLPRKAALCILYARQLDQCLLSLQFMNPNHRSG